MSTVGSWAYKRIYDGVNYRLRTLNGGRWASHCRPTSIVILLTELCNARCVHCDIWKNRGKEDSPSSAQWMQVLTDLRTWLGPVQVAFSGGEALLKPFATDLVSHGKSLGLFIEILTHGYWDDLARLERLAMANPFRITVSLDGLGETHSRVRGRQNFFEKTERSIKMFQRLRTERKLDYTIRLKNVIMAHNLDDVPRLAMYANQEGMDVFYQPIEQNYNTAEDPTWFQHSDNWPSDTAKVVSVVQQLIALKRQGLPIANSYAQLEVMMPYFQNPDAWRLSVQSHSAHEQKAICNATTTLQLQANGDVTVCTGIRPVGNIKSHSIREIWESRPRVWLEGCCLERRCSGSEQQTREIAIHS